MSTIKAPPNILITFYSTLFTTMPNSTFPAVISFGDNRKPIISAKYGEDDDADFAIRMANAVEVQEIDSNLYMSKELWLPAGARGVFGGQVKFRWKDEHNGSILV
jgi:hypothetical protein